MIFIDAHTGEIERKINLQKVDPNYLNSPFTHHITPSTVLSLADTISGKCPEAWLLSIRGYKFQFERSLTDDTNKHINTALELLEEKFLI